MTIGGLSCGFDPSWKVRDIMIVGNKCELQGFFCFQAEQQGPCVPNSESILRSLRENPYEPEFCDRARHYFRNPEQNQCSYPVGDSLMKFMLKETERHQSIHIEQISHGNSDKIS